METIVTQYGSFYAYYTKTGLARLVFPVRQTKCMPDAVKPNSEWRLRACAAINAILKGKDPSELPPLDISAGTNFQQQLWRMLLRVPVGEWCSYGELASKMSRPKAARAIGQACGATRGSRLFSRSIWTPSICISQSLILQFGTACDFMVKR